jgi:uridylate kinase
MFARIADEVCSVHALGVEVCLVLGGGNIFRGQSGEAGRHGARVGRLHGHARNRD